MHSPDAAVLFGRPSFRRPLSGFRSPQLPRRNRSFNTLGSNNPINKLPYTCLSRHSGRLSNHQYIQRSVAAVLGIVAFLHCFFDWSWSVKHVEELFTIADSPDRPLDATAALICLLVILDACDAD